MAKIMTVSEALEAVKAKSNAKGEKVINRFNKKNFNMVALAIANDVNFKSQVAKKNGDTCDVEDIMVTKEFRKWCKKFAEKLGVDSAESERILTGEFQIDTVDGLTDFMTAAIYEYMNAGNRFDFPNKKDFQGGFYLKDVKESKTVRDAKNPKDGSFIGTFETTKKNHKVLAVKSSCPTYLSSKRKIK